MRKILFVILLLVANVDALTQINSCSTLDIAGETYILTANITNSGTDNCITISADNITLNCQNHLIDGDDVAVNGIYASSVKNIEIINCYLSDWDTAGIFFDNVNYSEISNTEISSCPTAGIELDHSNYNTLSDLNLIDNDVGGIVLLGSNRNTLSDIYINGNNASDSVGIYIGFYDVGDYSNYNLVEDTTVMSNDYGVMIEDSHYNTLSNIIVRSNTIGVDFSYSRHNTLYNSQISHNSQQGIYIEGSNNSKIYFNIISDNGYGAVLSDHSTKNLIYNNLFNNTDDVNLVTSDINYWNVQPQRGTRIFTSGSLIGGNYWQSLSPTCPCGSDGFCYGEIDGSRGYIALEIGTNNVDNYPLCQYYPAMVGGTTTIPEIPELEVEPTPFEITITDDCKTELIYVTWTGKTMVNVILYPSASISKYFKGFPVSEIPLQPKKTVAIPLTACLPKDIIKIDGTLTFIVADFPEQKVVPTSIIRGKPLPKVICGDGICSEGETWWSCPEDCPFPYWYLLIIIIVGIAIYLITR
ncbi:MAG TPA: hypothetical protein ENF58_02080 [Candidatus Altiarchaeales archaeon]|nr:hypothetical protein [Candidatus Altiarchaeales archaeon]